MPNSIGEVFLRTALPVYVCNAKLVCSACSSLHEREPLAILVWDLNASIEQPSGNSHATLLFHSGYVLSLDHAPLCNVRLESQPSGWRKHTPPTVKNPLSSTRAIPIERPATSQDVLVQIHSMCKFIRLPAAHACGNHRVRQAPKLTLATNILVSKKAGEFLWGCRQAVAFGSTLRAMQP